MVHTVTQTDTQTQARRHNVAMCGQVEQGLAWAHNTQHTLVPHPKFITPKEKHVGGSLKRKHEDGEEDGAYQQARIGTGFSPLQTE
jgi:hypothetical protein